MYGYIGESKKEGDNMLIKIFGAVWIVLAVMLFLKPQAVTKWITNNKSKKYMIFSPGILGLLWIYIGVTHQGIPAKILLVLGVMGLIKMIMFLIPAVYDRMIEWALKIPVTLYRIGACIHIGIGVLLMVL